MLDTFAITGPIYLVMALGFAAGRLGVFSRADFRVLGSFVAKFALPALVFTALSQRPVGEIVDARYLVAYGSASLLVMLAGMGVGWFWQRKSLTLCALSGLGMASSNSGYIGYPIAVLVCGAAPAAVGLALCMLVENMMIIPLALVLADSGAAEEGAWHRILLGALAQFLRNPLFLGILAGFVVALLGIPVSEPLARSINLLAMSSTALSLFVIGGSLVGLQVAGMRRDATAIALGKLVLHPLAVGVLVFLLPPGDPMLKVAAVVFAGVPMLSIYPILAQKYGFESLCAATLLLATVVSFASISVLLWVVGPVLGWLP